MVAKKKKTKREERPDRPMRVRPPAVCYFCKEDKEPNYKEWEVLRPFVSDRAKIISPQRSGACAKHQRRLAREIKRARHLAFFPFIIRPNF